METVQLGYQQYHKYTRPKAPMRVRELRSVVIAVTKKDIFSATVRTARDSQLHQDGFVLTAAVLVM